MVRGMISLGAGLAVVALASLGRPAMAADPTIMIMAEDADAEGVARKSRVSTRILNELVTQMHSRGFDVYDETAVTLDTGVQGRSRRTDAELVDIARSVRKPPIDVVVFFTVYTGVTRKTYANDLHLRIVGRLLSTHDGRLLGNWEDELPDRWALPNRCFPDAAANPDRECILEVVGTDARKIAQGVGAVLTEKLEQQIAQGPKTARPAAAAPRADEGGLKKGYVLVFDGFDSRDMRDIEDYLVVFSGYIDHRPTSSVGMTHEVWYESTITEARLERNLNKMMELLDMPATLQFAGNKFTIRNKMMRKPRPRGDIKKLYDW